MLDKSVLFIDWPIDKILLSACSVLVDLVVMDYHLHCLTSTYDAGPNQLSLGDKSCNLLSPGDKSGNLLSPGDISSNQLSPGDNSRNQLSPGDKSGNRLSLGDKSCKVTKSVMPNDNTIVPLSVCSILVDLVSMDHCLHWLTTTHDFGQHQHTILVTVYC